MQKIYGGEIHSACLFTNYEKSTQLPLAEKLHAQTVDPPIFTQKYRNTSGYVFEIHAGLLFSASRGLFRRHLPSVSRRKLLAIIILNLRDIVKYFADKK